MCVQKDVYRLCTSAVPFHRRDQVFAKGGGRNGLRTTADTEEKLTWSFDLLIAALMESRMQEIHASECDSLLLLSLKLMECFSPLSGRLTLI